MHTGNWTNWWEMVRNSIHRGICRLITFFFLHFIFGFFFNWEIYEIALSQMYRKLLEIDCPFTRWYVLVVRTMFESYCRLRNRCSVTCRTSPRNRCPNPNQKAPNCWNLSAIHQSFSYPSFSNQQRNFFVIIFVFQVEIISF